METGIIINGVKYELIADDDTCTSCERCALDFLCDSMEDNFYPICKLLGGNIYHSFKKVND